MNSVFNTSLPQGYGYSPVTPPFQYAQSKPSSPFASYTNFPTTNSKSNSAIDPNAKVFTQINIKGYNPQEFYTHKLWAWLQIQAKGLLDFKIVDDSVKALWNWVGNLAKKFKNIEEVDDFIKNNSRSSFVDNSKTTAELMGLRQIDSLGQRVDIERLVQEPQAYGKQIATQGKALKGAFQSWTQSPKSLMSGTKQFLHASFTRPFTQIWAGQDVISNALSGLASVLFVVDVGTKTHNAYESAYNEGQRGTELAQTTAIEGVKETTKGGLTWMAGSLGAALVGHTFGTNIGAIKDGSKWARFKNLPTRLAVVAGAVLAGATAQSILDWVMPSRPKVQKVSLNDLKRESTTPQEEEDKDD